MPGENSSKDPVKINQCKVPKCDGPNFKKSVAKRRESCTGYWNICNRHT